ncbi:MAG TPA: hypothetical protein VL326_03980 [Kofleriaceae bacterium]|nr:hypothetical protein [Kofleriaceae bacterium]
MTRALLVGVILIVACAPARPRVGSRTIVIDVPMGSLTNDMHRQSEVCEPCRRDQRDGEKLLSCAINNESGGAHWDTMTCFFEGR